RVVSALVHWRLDPRQTTAPAFGGRVPDRHVSRARPGTAPSRRNLWGIPQSTVNGYYCSITVALLGFCLFAAERHHCPPHAPTAGRAVIRRLGGASRPVFGPLIGPRAVAPALSSRACCRPRFASHILKDLQRRLDESQEWPASPSKIVSSRS